MALAVPLFSTGPGFLVPESIPNPTPLRSQGAAAECRQPSFAKGAREAAATRLGCRQLNSSGLARPSRWNSNYPQASFTCYNHFTRLQDMLANKHIYICK